MRPRAGWIRLALYSLLPAGLLGLAGCSASLTTVGFLSPPVNNVQPVSVNLGPAGNTVNGIFTDVTLCARLMATHCRNA
ncbi:MAG: hypothetical protein P8Z30_04680 [Acidobacteriota bacterium]